MYNTVDEDNYYDVCGDRSTERGHKGYGMCQASVSATASTVSQYTCVCVCVCKIKYVTHFFPSVDFSAFKFVESMRCNLNLEISSEEVQSVFS